MEGEENSGTISHSNQMNSNIINSKIASPQNLTTQRVSWSAKRRRLSLNWVGIEVKLMLC